MTTVLRLNNKRRGGRRSRGGKSTTRDIPKFRVFNAQSGEWLCDMLDDDDDDDSNKNHLRNNDNDKLSNTGGNGNNNRLKKEKKNRDIIVAHCTTLLRPPIITKISNNNNDDNASSLSSSSSSSSPIILFAPIKKPRVKFMIEKCTELGAANFGMVQSEYTNEKGMSTVMNVDKLKIQAIEAAEQCER